MERTWIDYRFSALCKASRYDVVDTILSFFPLRNKVQTLALRAEVLLTKIADPAFHKRMIGKYKLDVFGGSGFVAKAMEPWVVAWICARHKVWTQVLRYTAP